MIVRDTFFPKIRASSTLFRASMNQGQVDGVNAILDEWDKRGLVNVDWLAYMLATPFWETAQTMQPIEEWGKGRGRTYGTPDPTTGKTYYGRGLVQLTWLENYRKFGAILGIDLVNHPELACTLPVAVAIMFDGMLRDDLHPTGTFTGVSLNTYTSASGELDFYNARRTINSLDHAEQIADVARAFKDAIIHH